VIPINQIGQVLLREVSLLLKSLEYGTVYNVEFARYCKPKRKWMYEGV